MIQTSTLKSDQYYEDLLAAMDQRFLTTGPVKVWLQEEISEVNAAPAEELKTGATLMESQKSRGRGGNNGGGRKKGFVRPEWVDAELQAVVEESGVPAEAITDSSDRSLAASRARALLIRRLIAKPKVSEKSISVALGFTRSTVRYAIERTLRSAEEVAETTDQETCTHARVQKNGYRDGVQRLICAQCRKQWEEEA